VSQAAGAIRPTTVNTAPRAIPVKGPWRYEQIDGASHWIPLEASDQLNQLLIEWLG
jgi:pimeloyl-ACP methyl ester carboxylesterase